MVANGLQVASLRRRLAALAIDTVVVGVPFIGASVGFGWLWMRWRGPDAEPVPDWVRSRQAQLVLSSLSVPSEIAMRNRRGVGYRALGLRRVDARTGGPVSARSVLIRSSFTRAWSRSARVLTGMDRRFEAERRAADAEAEEARRRYADDPEEARRATDEIYRRHSVVRGRGCLLTLASILLIYVPAFWSPLNQTLPDRVAGVVVIRE